MRFSWCGEPCPESLTNAAAGTVSGCSRDQFISSAGAAFMLRILRCQDASPSPSCFAEPLPFSSRTKQQSRGACHSLLTNNNRWDPHILDHFPPPSTAIVTASCFVPHCGLHDWCAGSRLWKMCSAAIKKGTVRSFFQHAPTTAVHLPPRQQQLKLVYFCMSDPDDVMKG